MKGLAMSASLCPDASPPVIDTLWTGGWDSTFRIADALLVKKRSVQPHYIIDPWRPSSGMEIKTIARIRRVLSKRLPDGVELLPTLFTDVPGIDPDPAISASWDRMNERAPLGEQYGWIARYAAMKDIRGLELSVHVDDRARPYNQDLIEIDDCGSQNFEMSPNADQDTANMFGRMRFPLMGISKVEMQRRADEAGFGDIMKMTWFCHNPKRNKPCGMCYPCKFAMEEGMSRRLPPLRRLKARLIWTGPGQQVRTVARRLLRPA
jgi:hypothetical protein